MRSVSIMTYWIFHDFFHISYIHSKTSKLPSKCLNSLLPKELPIHCYQESVVKEFTDARWIESCLKTKSFTHKTFYFLNASRGFLQFQNWRWENSMRKPGNRAFHNCSMLLLRKFNLLYSTVCSFGRLMSLAHLGVIWFKGLKHQVAALCQHSGGPQVRRMLEMTLFERKTFQSQRSSFAGNAWFDGKCSNWLLAHYPAWWQILFSSFLCAFVCLHLSIISYLISSFQGLKGSELCCFVCITLLYYL